MDIEKFRNYCLSKKQATEGFPFGKDVLVFKVANKMFALARLQCGKTANLKCDPEKAINLREKYTAVEPGYHMSKKHWNTIHFTKDLTDKEILKLIDHSYDLVVQKLPKKLKEELK